jgi:hypothetical protein
LTGEALERIIALRQREEVSNQSLSSNFRKINIDASIQFYFALNPL